MLCNRNSITATDPADYLLSGPSFNNQHQYYGQESMVFDVEDNHSYYNFEMPFECDKNMFTMEHEDSFDTISTN